jgi:uncharacterized protein
MKRTGGAVEFEWDEDKRRRNIAKHGIDFVRVTAMFDGRNVVSVPSPYPLEPRTLTIGILDDAPITVVWTDRNGKARLISVRPASRRERALFRDLTEM